MSMNLVWSLTWKRILQLKERGRENTLFRLFATVKLIHNYNV